MVVPTLLPGTRNPSSRNDDASEASRSSYTDDYSMEETVMTPLFSFGKGWFSDDGSYATGFSKSIAGSFESADESETFISQGGGESCQGTATDGHTIASSIFDGISVSESQVKPTKSWQGSGKKFWKSRSQQKKEAMTKKHKALERVVEQRDSMSSGSCSSSSSDSSDERDSADSSQSDSLYSEESRFRTTSYAPGSVIAAPSRRPSNIVGVGSVEQRDGATDVGVSDCDLATKAMTPSTTELKMNQSTKSKNNRTDICSEPEAPSSTMEVIATSTKSLELGDELPSNEGSVSEASTATCQYHDKEIIEFTLSQSSVVRKTQGCDTSVQNESKSIDSARMPEQTSPSLKDTQGYEVTLAQLQKSIESMFSGEASPHQVQEDTSKTRIQASGAKLEYACKPVVQSVDCNTNSNLTQTAFSSNDVPPDGTHACVSDATNSIASQSPNRKSEKPPRATNRFRSIFPQKQARNNIPRKMSNIVELSESDSGGVEGAIIDAEIKMRDQQMHVRSSMAMCTSEKMPVKLEQKTDIERATANIQAQDEKVVVSDASSIDDSVARKERDSVAPVTSSQDDQSTFEISIEVPMEATKKVPRSGFFQFGKMTGPKKALAEPEKSTLRNSVLCSNQELLSTRESDELKVTGEENREKESVDGALINLTTSLQSSRSGNVQGSISNPKSSEQTPNIHSSEIQRSDEVLEMVKPPKVWRTPSGRPSSELVKLPNVLPKPNNKNKTSKRLAPKKSLKRCGTIPEKLPLPAKEKNRKLSQLKQLNGELGRDSSRPVNAENLELSSPPIAGGTQEHVASELDAVSNVPAINVAPREELSNFGILMECLTCQDCANTETHIPLRRDYNAPLSTSNLHPDKQLGLSEKDSDVSKSKALKNTVQIPNAATTASAKKLLPAKTQRQETKVTKPSPSNEKSKRKGMFSLFARKQSSKKKSNKNLRSMVTEVKAEKMMKTRRSQSPGRVARENPPQLSKTSIPAAHTWNSSNIPLSPQDQPRPSQMNTLQEPPSNDGGMGMWNPQRLLLYTNTYD